MYPRYFQLLKEPETLPIIKDQSSLSKQSIYLVVGKIIAFALTMTHPMVLVRIFSKEDYGLYAQLLLIFTTVFSLAEMGAVQGIYYFLPRYQDMKDKIIVQNLVFVAVTGIFSSVFILAFRGWITTFFHDPHMLPYFYPLAFYSFFMISSSLFEPIMVAEGQARVSSMFIVVFQIAHSATVILCSIIMRDLFVLMIALAIFSLGRFFAQFIFLHNKYELWPSKIQSSLWKHNLAYSFPVGLSNFAWFLQSKLHGYAVSFFFSARIYAIYAIGTFNLPIVTIITSSVASVLTPELSRCQEEGKHARIRMIRNSAIRKMNLFFFPIFVFFFLTANEWFILLFTKHYIESVPLFRISLISVLFSSINNVAILSAYAQTKYMMKISFVRLPLTAIGVYIFTRLWGIYGAVSAGICVSLVCIAIEFIKVGSVLQIPYRQIIEWQKNFKILGVAILSGLPVFLVHHFFSLGPIVFLSISFFSYAVFYGFLSLILSTVSTDELTGFRNYALSAVRLNRCRRQAS